MIENPNLLLQLVAFSEPLLMTENSVLWKISPDVFLVVIPEGNLLL
jgi:hypothetical protein